MRRHRPRGFDRSQRGWSSLRESPGFLAQFGGWSGERAHVLGVWTDERTHEAFMAGPHDHLAATQRGSYHSIDVRLFAGLGESRLADALAAGDAGGAVVRLAHCHVKPDRRAHFVEVQHEVWNAGMAAAPGMLGTAFGHRGETEFLVLSLWASAANQERYRAERFPALRQRSGAAGDLATITGELIRADPLWTVRPAT